MHFDRSLHIILNHFKAIPEELESPLSKLLVLRSDPTVFGETFVDEFKQEDSYRELPFFDRRSLLRFARSSATDEAIRKSLASINFTLEYSPDMTQDFLSNETPTNLETFLFLYNCFAWFSSYQNYIQVPNLLKCFKNLIKTEFQVYGNEFFKEMLKLDIPIEYSQFVFDFLLEPNVITQSSYYLMVAFFNRILVYKDQKLMYNMSFVIAQMVDIDLRYFSGFNLAPLIEVICPLVNEMDLNALTVLCKCSSMSKSKIINDVFAKLPKILFDFVQSHQITIEGKMFNKTPIEVDVTDEDDDFKVPSMDLIGADLQFESFCQPEEAEFLEKLFPILAWISDSCASTIINSLMKMKQKIMNSQYYLDYIIIIARSLLSIAQKIDLSCLIDLFYNEITFEHTNTVFTSTGLTDAQNYLRNAIIKLLFYSNQNCLNERLIYASIDPLMFAEHMYRLYHFDPQFIKRFKGNELIVSVIVGSSLALQQIKFPKYVQHLNLARSITYTILFGLLEDKEIALCCFNSTAFTPGFLSLIFEPKMTSIIVRSLITCLSQFDVLPEIVLNFLISVFDACSSHNDDPQFTEIASKLSHGIIKTIALNISLGASFLPIFDAALKYISVNPDQDLLMAVLQLCGLIAQSLGSFEITSSRFNSLVDLIRITEGNEPSDVTMNKLLNLMSSTTSMQTNLQFLIKFHNIVPVILIAFSQSDRLEYILDCFVKLCEFSLFNVNQMHEGEADYILLKALHGDFKYKRRQISFKFTPDIINNVVFKLIGIIVANRSSYHVDKAFMKLFMPNKNNEFHPLAQPAISCLNEVFSSLDHAISPQYEIGHPLPIFATNEINPVQVQDGFAFTFYARIDLGFLKNFTEPIMILHIFDDIDSNLYLFIQQDTLYLRHEGNGLRNSVPLTKSMPTNKWSIFTLMFYQIGDSYNAEVRIGLHPCEPVDFVAINFSSPMTIHIGKTAQTVIPPYDLTPVSIGAFALIGPPFKSSMLDKVHMQGFDALNEFENVVITNNSKLYKTSILIRDSHTIVSSLKNHCKVSDFYPIFAHLDKAPDHFAELGVATMMHAIDFDQDTTEYLLGESLVTDLTLTSSIVYQKFKHLLNYKLYISYLDLLVTIHNERLLEDFFKSTIVNIFLWSNADELNFKRIYKAWNTSFSLLENYITPSVFPQVLIQSHMIKRTPDYDSFRFIFLNQISSVSISKNDIHLIIEIMLSLKNIDEILSYLKLLTENAERNPDIIDLNTCLTLIKFVELGNGEIFDQIITLLDWVKFEEKHQIMSYFALMFYENGDKIVNNLDVACIRALMKNQYDNIKELFETGKPKNTKLWFFWPILFALHNPEYYDLVVSYLIKLNTRPAFSAVMDLLDLIEGIKLHEVQIFKEKYLTAFLVANQEYGQYEKVVVRLFISCYYMFKETPFSHALMQLAGMDTCEDPHNTTFSKDYLKEVIQKDYREYELKYEKAHSEVSIKALKRLLEINTNKTVPISYVTSILTSTNPNYLISIFDAFQKQVIPLKTRNLHEMLASIREIFNLRIYEPIHVLEKEINKQKARLEIMEMDLTYKAPYRNSSANCVSCAFLSFIEENKIDFYYKYHPTPAIWLTEPPTKMLNMYVERLGDISFWTKELHIHSPEFHTQVIPYDSITLVVTIRNNDIEIFTSACYSYLINFKKDGDKTRAICILSKRHVPILHHSPLLIQRILQAWSNGLVSNFEMLLSINILSGRTFNDINTYPRYPLIYKDQNKYAINSSIIQNDQESTNFIKELINKEQIDVNEILKTAYNNDLCIPPQLYFQFNETKHPGIPEPYQNVYDFVFNYRTLLDSNIISSKLPKWIQMKCSVPVEQQFIKGSNPNIYSLKISSFKSAGFYGIFKNSFYLVRQNTIEFFGIDWKANAKIIPMSSFQFQTESLRFTFGDNFMVAHNKVTGKIYKVTPQFKLFSTRYFKNFTHFETVGYKVVSVIDEKIIQISSVADFPFNSRTIFYEKDQIVLLKTSKAFDVVVYVTCSGFLKVVTLSDGKLLGRYDLNCVVDHLLITEYWGFILLINDVEMSLFSLKADLIKKTNLVKPISACATTRIGNVDYFIICDTGNSIYSMSAFDFENRTFLARMKNKITKICCVPKEGVVGMFGENENLYFFQFPDCTKRMFNK